MPHGDRFSHFQRLGNIELRKFCTEYHVNIVFTTHSLALMKTLLSPELQYMENEGTCVTLTNVSYNYVKSILFGFQGWDKYILTEDEMLEKYLNYLLTHDDHSIFSKYKIIYIAGGSQVVSLMNRNKTEQFLSSPDNVISVLDGDQRNLKDCRNTDKIFFIPFDSVEKQLRIHYENNELDFEVEVTGSPKILLQTYIMKL